MIKSLLDARLVDALPRVVAGQDWVRALSDAVGVLHGKTLQYIDDSQIYTNLDNAEEAILDALAVSWKVDWYDTGYSIDQKRRIIKTALAVFRQMGTVGAVKMQLDAICPGTTLEEWFQYGGQPGYFRIITNDPTVDNVRAAELAAAANKAKRLSAWLEEIVTEIDSPKIAVQVKMACVSGLEASETSLPQRTFTVTKLAAALSLAAAQSITISETTLPETEQQDTALSAALYMGAAEGASLTETCLQQRG